MKIIITEEQLRTIIESKYLRSSPILQELIVKYLNKYKNRLFISFKVFILYEK